MTRHVRNPAVLFQTVDNGAVLLHTENEIYFGLNQVGAEVWELLTPTCSALDELCAELGRRYPNVAPNTLREDVSELLDSLTAHGLLCLATTE